MKAFASIFNRKAKCHNCKTLFKLKKRRQCTICSKFYIENLFCDKCSIKLNHKSLGFFTPKKYCLVCYVSISVEQPLDGNTSAVIPSPPKISPAKLHADKAKSVEVNKVCIDSDEEQDEEDEEYPNLTSLPSQEMVFPT